MAPPQHRGAGSIPAARPIEPPIARGNPRADGTRAAPHAPTAPTARSAGRCRRDRRWPSVPPPAASPAGQAQGVEHYGPPLTNPAPGRANAGGRRTTARRRAAPAPARGNAVVNINDLPPNVRATLPHLAVGGAIYSETPSGRMLILNGQIYHEGDRPAPDTVIEQIRLKSAILNFRGQRYEVSF